MENNIDEKSYVDSDIEEIDEVHSNIGTYSNLGNVSNPFKDITSSFDAPNLSTELYNAIPSVFQDKIFGMFNRAIASPIIDTADFAIKTADTAIKGFATGVNELKNLYTGENDDRLKRDIYGFFTAGSPAAATRPVNISGRVKQLIDKGDNIEAGKLMYSHVNPVAAMSVKKAPSMAMTKPKTNIPIEEIKIATFPENQKRWFLDSDTVTIYHGTSLENLNEVVNKGLKGDKDGLVYTSPDVHSATGYGSVRGGEKANLRARKTKLNIGDTNRITLKYEIPKKEFLKLVGDPNKTQRSRRSMEKLFRKDSKNFYNKTKDNSAHNYYEGTEIRFKEGDIDKYLVGAVRRVRGTKEQSTRQIANTEYDKIFSQLDKAETPEKWQSAAKKIVSEERDITGKNVVRRTPALEKSARDLIDNKLLTRKEHLKNIAKNKQIVEWTNLPRQPSSKAVVFSLDTSQRKTGLFLLSKEDATKLGVKQTTLKEGDLFYGRLDIPAYQKYDTWVVAGTSPAVKTADGKGVTTYAKAIHYTSSADNEPVKFIASRKISERIGKGQAGKTGYATIAGRYKATSEQDLRNLAIKLLDDPEWSQVGFDPRRLGTFYLRKATDKHGVGSVVTEADEVIQIGPLVLAKNVKIDSTYKGYKTGGLVTGLMSRVA